MIEITLTNEERNVLLAMIDFGSKAAGAQVYRDGAGGIVQSAFTKLAEAKEMAPKEEK